MNNPKLPAKDTVNTSTERKPTTAELVEKSLAKRYRKEKRFKFFGMASIIFGLLALAFLMFEIAGRGLSAFSTVHVQLEIEFNKDTLELYDIADTDQLNAANFDGVIREALRKRFPDVKKRRDKRDLYRLMSVGAGYQLKDHIVTNPDDLGGTKTLWLLADDDFDTYVKTKGPMGKGFSSRLSEKQLEWINSLLDSGEASRKMNINFFVNGDSSEPEIAGILGALKGSLFTLLVTFFLSFPIGVAAAIYLEEYAPKNKLTDFIEVNINNLAAVPSIIFGLLGLAIFVGTFGVPRSVPLVGGLVLTLMTLPTVIISARASIKSVPPSIREAALGMGASKMQVILHHILPLAMPGMLTGAIIGMAQALGETAPLLMIGMVAFIVDIPNGIMDPATVLPVQIFLWADSPEKAFVDLTSAAIMVLMVFLIFMNTCAVWLRKKLERRW